MPTTLELARRGEATAAVRRVARQENVTEDQLLEELAQGRAVVLASRQRPHCRPVGIGRILRTKVSASVGMFGTTASMEAEWEKVHAALSAGTDTLMDLSVSGNIDALYRKILLRTNLPLGTLPLYQALAMAREKYGHPAAMTVEDLFAVIEQQAREGVDFIAVHAGVTQQVLDRARRDGRQEMLVSFGGSHLIGWMALNQQENPLYVLYDRLLDICRQYDTTIALADAFRPGCLDDSLDGPQVQELIVLGELVRRARQAGVQIMVKGPGHVPLHHLSATVTLQKRLCHGAPYFVFGPVVTDISPGYDHISAAIGGALSALAGAEFLCYVTEAEHLSLPDARQVHEGVIAARIAAHAADLARGLPGAADWDNELSRARKNMEWEKQIALAIDPERARRQRQKTSADSPACAMCGKYCAMQVIAQYLNTPVHSC
ncbi:MAG: phosphomethylpyrimidine synthase ThiC [Bacillota bacterium]|uniref:phosphomethylpyrimidine synthase ThiC n=1 Tax=Desulfurispora thermophila TaxID=265470 RepID=UPI00037DE955|nr:phosphomethylpyrimidine synthase ThiC [Desulfurispora thermophila]